MGFWVINIAYRYNILPNITDIAVERQTWNFKSRIPDVFSVDLYYTKMHYAFTVYYLERKELI